jgi:tetratricopeptide (TPR) repeat protein
METTDSYRIASRSTNDAEIWVKYGDEMMSKRQIGKAVEFYDRALESTSSHTQAQAWNSKANALDAMGRHDDAIRCYDSALKCDPQDAECWFNKGLTLKKLGREDEGMICINKGVHIAMGR